MSQAQEGCFLETELKERIQRYYLAGPDVWARQMLIGNLLKHLTLPRWMQHITVISLVILESCLLCKADTHGSAFCHSAGGSSADTRVLQTSGPQKLSVQPQVKVHLDHACQGQNPHSHQADDSAYNPKSKCSQCGCQLIVRQYNTRKGDYAMIFSRCHCQLNWFALMQ